MDFLKRSDEILSVSDFSARFKMLVKTNIPELWLRGEVSNLKTYSSGHTYFTLKDDNAAISAVLFKGYAQGSSARLAEGMKILAYGEISVYEARGNYQIVLKAFMPDGVGDLAQRFEALKKKLADEGLFEQSRKRAIPPLPKRIAVVTSPTGAAIRDFISILRRRKFSGEIMILPSRVQGSEAAAEIATQVEIAQMMGFDLLVVMRGGGSLEDLWPFNEEIVARAMAASNIPTISAVGHEIDFTLSDFAADLRAETPSGAAEFISSKYLELNESLKQIGASIADIVKNAIGGAKEKLAVAEEFFRHANPTDKLMSLAIQLDDIEGRLKSALSENISDKKHRLAELHSELSALNPTSKIAVLKANLDSAEKQMELLSVDNTLKRGFTMAVAEDGALIKRAKDAPQSFKLKFFDADKDVTLS